MVMAVGDGGGGDGGAQSVGHGMTRTNAFQMPMY